MEDGREVSGEVPTPPCDKTFAVHTHCAILEA